MVESLTHAGIALRGPRDPFEGSTVRINDNRTWSQVALWGTRGLARAYENGWWDCERPDVVVEKAVQHGLDSKLFSSSLSDLALKIRAALFNLQSRARAFVVGEKHYNAGNTLFETMLGKHPLYSCAYWSGTPRAQTLDDAQEAKLHLICRKLKLKRGDHILDIGCGFGELLRFAHEHYGVTGVGITISKEQAKFARKLVHGLPIEIWEVDYRDLQTSRKFDREVSVGMFEHVGQKNHRAFFEMAQRHLKQDGLFLLHTITGSGEADPFLNDDIFPGSVVPSLKQVERSAQQRFKRLDLHEFGRDYDPTCCEWEKNLSHGWTRIAHLYNNDEKFLRRWRLYLLMSAGLFRAGKTSVAQFVLSNCDFSYDPVR